MPSYLVMKVIKLIVPQVQDLLRRYCEKEGRRNGQPSQRSQILVKD